jgi:Transposase IS116/IS110/IS902 family
MTCAASTPPRRSCAVFFHQGAPQLSAGALRTEQGIATLRAAAAAHLSPAGQLQVATALDMLTALEARLEVLRHRLLDAARHLTGARVLAARLYGVGPVTALAMTCWLAGAGRFSSSRKAVRFAGLDITVYSSDGKRSPGHLSRQGPAVLRWAVYEAGKVHARACAPDHAYYAQVKDRKGGKRAALPKPARSSGRPATSSASSATTRSPPPEPDPVIVTIPVIGRPRAGKPQPHSPDGDHRGQLPPVRCQPLPVLPRRTRRTACIDRAAASPAGGGHPISHHVAGANSQAPRA